MATLATVQIVTSVHALLARLAIRADSLVLVLDGQVNQMTLHSRHWIQNSGPEGLRPSPLPFGHGGSP